MKRNLDPVGAPSVVHSLLRALSELDYDLTAPGQQDKLVKLLRHYELGLSAEDEFASLLGWLGRCSLAHKLDQDYVAPPGVEWKIPDLVACFDHAGERFVTLIEVKSTDATELVFTKMYVEQLRRYATVVGLPLLLAWRSRSIGPWILIDLDAGEEAAEKVKFDYFTAVRDNLLGSIAGDFLIEPYKGAGLTLSMQIEEKVPVGERSYLAQLRITDSSFHDRTGRPLSDVPGTLFFALMASAESIDGGEGDRLMQSFVSDGRAVWAQQVLRTALSLELKEDERIHWKQVGRKIDSLFSAADLWADLSKHFGSCIHILGDVRPQRSPTFAPTGWSRVPRASAREQ